MTASSNPAPAEPTAKRALVISLILVRRSPCCILLFLLALILSLTAGGTASAAEPTFPGRGKEEEAYQRYWKDFGKYVLENAPYYVKNGTNIDKARYITSQVGDKMAALGLKPNTALLFGPGGGRVGGFFAEGPCDRGSCGDVTNTLDSAFGGAGIEGSFSLKADSGSVESTVNIMSVNRDHGTVALTDKDGHIHVFDLWHHGRDSGTFAGAGTSQWNGMTAKEWMDRLKKAGYERFGEGHEGGTFGDDADVIDRIEKAMRARARLEAKRQQKKDEAKRKAEDDAKRRVQEQTGTVQQRQKPEDMISSLEAELVGLETARNLRVQVHRWACEAVEKAEQIMGQARLAMDEVILKTGPEIAEASLHCKDVERLTSAITTRADNAKRYADLAQRGFDEIQQRIYACVSRGVVMEAIENLNAAEGLMTGAARNLDLARDAVTALKVIRSELERVKKTQSELEKLPEKFAAWTSHADRAFAWADHWERVREEKTVQIAAGKGEMLARIGTALAMIGDDDKQVGARDRLRALRDRLTGEEPSLENEICATDVAMKRDNGMEEMREKTKWAGALVEGLKSIQLCDKPAIPDQLVDDAARAVNIMSTLRGRREALAQQGSACLARLKPPEKPVAGTSGQGPGAGGRGPTDPAEPPQPPTPPQEPPTEPPGPPPPLPHVLSRFGISCPATVPAGKAPGCQATGEWSDRPGDYPALPATFTYSPSPAGTKAGDVITVTGSYAGASDSAIVTVVENKKKGPTDNGGQKPPDIEGATEAGTQFQGQTPGGQSSGPTSGVTGGGPPIEQPGQRPPAGTDEPPTAGTGGPAGPGAGQGIWCYSEKTGQSYQIPYGPCPSPHLPPPTVGGTPHDPRTPWQGLVPPSGGGDGHGGGGHSKPPKGGTTGGVGPTSPPTCPPGCHIKPGTTKCHCGGK